MNRTKLTRRIRPLIAAVVVGGGLSLLGGCNDAQSGSLIGASVGALAGQALGGDTEATLLGTGIGLGAGYIIGNESDKAKAQHPRGNYDY